MGRVEEEEGHHYKSVYEFRKSVEDYMTTYNSIRIHEAIHYLTPNQKEADFWAKQAKTDEAVQSLPTISASSNEN